MISKGEWRKNYLTVHVSTRMCIKLPGRDGCDIRDLSEGAGGGGRGGELYLTLHCDYHTNSVVRWAAGPERGNMTRKCP